MRCVDVSVLVYAHREDMPEHDSYRSLVARWANADEPLGLPDSVLSGFVRVITNRRIFTAPTVPDEAWTQVGSLLEAPATVLLRPGERHWEHFARLAQQIAARGNDITDAYLAAFALENNATWVSADRGFSRFDGLTWSHPFDG